MPQMLMAERLGGEAAGHQAGEARFKPGRPIGVRDTFVRRLIDILQGTPQSGLGRIFGGSLFYAFDKSSYF